MNENPTAPPRIGSMLLASTDPDRLRAWYEDVFGVHADHDGFLHFGDVGLLIDRRDDVAARAAEPGRVLINLHVEDARAVAKRLDAREVTWLAELEYREGAGAWFATLVDPDGNYVQIIEVTDEYWVKRRERLLRSAADATVTGALDVPGARLRYEVRGSGPLLLLIPGGAADAAVFTSLVPQLAADYTVVTYDPRGISRSTLDDPTQDISVAAQADDAHRLLAELDAGPAYVLGSSGGAVTGLALVARHPADVRTLVAHEPPVVELLPDRERQRAQTEELHEIYRREGVDAAMAKFLANTGMDNGGEPEEPPSEPDPEMQAGMARMQGNMSLFFEHMMRPIIEYRPDLAVLRVGSPRVVVAVGAESAGQLAHRAAVALAESLGQPTATFAGDHGGFASHPAEFAATLRQVFAESA